MSEAGIRIKFEPRWITNDDSVASCEFVCNLLLLCTEKLTYAKSYENKITQTFTTFKSGYITCFYQDLRICQNFTIT